MIIYYFSIALCIISIIFLFNLNTSQVSNDLVSLITPKETLSEKSERLRSGKKGHRLYRKLMSIKNALAYTGRSRQFDITCCISLVMFIIGALLSVMIHNLLLLPVLGVAFGLMPFFYVARTLSFYEKNIREELETALSIITTSYLRNDDIVMAVRENRDYIKPPLREVFQAFEGDATAISSNVNRAIYSLKDRVDNEIFHEWCDALLRCQDDRTMKDTLLPIVRKLTDIRNVNTEMSTLMSEARNEYLVMAALVVGNVPLLYLLNKEWFDILVNTIQGKAVCGVCGITVLVTALCMLKFTRPVEYKG